MKKQSEITRKIWASLDELRDRTVIQIEDIKLLEVIAETKGIETVETILQNESITKQLISSDNRLTPPIYIYNFINSLSKFVNPKTHLDPWLTPSSPCVHFDFGKTTALCFQPIDAEIIKTLFPKSNIEIQMGLGITHIQNIKPHFDFISSLPILGMRTPPVEIKGIKTSNDFPSTLLIQSSLLLNENGLAVFLMSSKFLNDTLNKEIIEKLGLFVDAVFSIPEGAFSPMTRMATNLIVVTKKQKEKTFIAEISSDEITNRAIIDNYKSRKEGKAIQLGSLINFNEFKSFKSFVSQNEMKELAKRVGYPSIKLTDIAISINLLKEIDADEVEHLSNSIYLPKIGNNPAVVMPSEMKMKNPKNYFQIQLDETKANSTYVANYFNSNIGRKLRESLEVGVTIASISKSQLQTCVMQLPELNTQIELIKIDSKLDQVTLRLEELKRNLWKQPKRFRSIEKELKNINKEENLEEWIDNLPFPLSSILWRYYATNDSGKKIEHLFHFFEALSEFFSLIMLSALVQDKEFYKQECHNWIDNDEKFKEWYFKATFGSWNNLNSRLSKSIRRYYADSNRKDFCNSLFGNPTESFMQMLSEKGIINILIVVADLRNKWKGHGGISSEVENKHRVTTLEQYLNELRRYLADGFEDTRIISAKQGILDEGVWTFTAKELVGAKSPFKEIEVKSLVGLDVKKLYLTHANQNTPIELLPFMKFFEISDAVYFYSCIESKNVRWVSYHFEKEPGKTLPADNELYKAFDFLKHSDVKN